MQLSCKSYTGGYGYSTEFERVRQFLLRINAKQVTTPNFLWGRWEWMHTLPYMNTEKTDKIGLFEEDGQIVGLVTYEDDVGEAYFCIDPAHRAIKKEMLLYARENLAKEGKLRVLIPEGDMAFARAARRLGFVPTQERQYAAVADIPSLSCTCRDGFTITSIGEGCDIRKFNRLLHRGFNHAGPAPEDERSLALRSRSISSPHTIGELNILVVAPNGEYASYCGLWHETGSAYALVEPVCTDPNYRRMGCGRTVVIESVRRAGARGAKRAYVGSSQQFYYNIGFAPFSSEVWWEMRG